MHGGRSQIADESFPIVSAYFSGPKMRVNVDCDESMVVNLSPVSEFIYAS